MTNHILLVPAGVFTCIALIKITHWLLIDPYGVGSNLRLLGAYRVDDGYVNIHAFKRGACRSRDHLEASLRIAGQTFAWKKDMEALACCPDLTSDSRIFSQTKEGESITKAEFLCLFVGGTPFMRRLREVDGFSFLQDDLFATIDISLNNLRTDRMLRSRVTC